MNIKIAKIKEAFKVCYGKPFLEQIRIFIRLTTGENKLDEKKENDR